MTEPAIKCRGQCGLAVVNDEDAVRAGWTYLQITRGWRCGACGRALRAAAEIKGSAEVPSDALPSNSIGALRRETASTILPPSVKG